MRTCVGPSCVLSRILRRGGGPSSSQGIVKAGLGWGGLGWKKSRLVGFGEELKKRFFFFWGVAGGCLVGWSVGSRLFGLNLLGLKLFGY